MRGTESEETITESREKRLSTPVYEFWRLFRILLQQLLCIIVDRLETKLKFWRISTMRLLHVIGIFVAAIGFSVSASGQDLPSTRVLTFNVAQTMAQEAMAKCRADGYKVSVVVVDPLNEPIVVLRDDGSVPANLEFAKLEATTAMFFRKPSGTAYSTPSSPQHVMLGLLPGTWNHAGAVPIKAGDYTIGAIAVAGAHQEGDVACANAGIAKVADKLK
jgi:uncharacterized protein GlcG (DUF336 family)